jgi:hypothetical protein
MGKLRKVSVSLVATALLGVIIQESIHFYRYGHLASLGLHAEVIVTTRADLLGIEGIAEIYDARLTNYGIFPVTMTVCDCLDSGAPETMVAYIVERWDARLDGWKMVTEWDDYGSRLFCHPSFEVTETHLAPRRLWPGQSIRVGQVIPPERDGFQVGDYGRFTIFLRADGDRSASLSTPAFRVDRQKKNQGMQSLVQH